MNLPTFLIVGAIKCGTTSLYEYLRQHPEVFMPRRKEPNFFAGASHGNRVTEAEYRALFARATQARAAGEASVAYLYDPGSSQRIYEYLGPETRIVIMLRNPVDMMYALWGHMVRAGGEKLPFLEALEAEPARMQDDLFRSTRIGWLYNYAYADRARYAPQVERYLKRFGPDMVSISIFEEFFSDASHSFKGLCRFLGVADTFVPSFRKFNPTGPVISMALQDALQQRRLWKEPLKRLMSTHVRRWLKTKIYKLNRTHRVALPPLPAETRAKLWERFEPEVLELEQLLGRSLRDAWCKTERPSRDSE